MKNLACHFLMLVLTLSACGKKADYGDLASYEKASPDADLQRALGRNDLKFIALMGYAEYVPGVKDYDDKYSKYGYKVIKGSSDVIRDYEHGRLMVIAEYYADNYNRMLLEHINKIDSQAMSESLTGYGSLKEEFIVENTMTGHINLLPESLFASLASRKNLCVNRAWWFNPLDNGRPTYNWTEFLDVFRDINKTVCQHKWIGEWIVSGAKRSAEASVFGVRPYTETDYEPFVKTPWQESALASEPTYEIKLRDGEDCVATVFVGQDGQSAMITSSQPKGGKHWLDKEKVFYHPRNSQPQVIVVDQKGNWRRQTLRQHNQAL